MIALTLFTMVLVVLPIGLVCSSTDINHRYVKNKCRDLETTNLVLENCTCAVLKGRNLFRNRECSGIDQAVVDHKCHDIAKSNIIVENCTCATLKGRGYPCHGRVTHAKCTVTVITWVRALVNIISSSGGVIGNLLVIVVRFPHCKKWAHYNFIVGLAIADLIYCILNVALSVPELNMCGWVYSRAFCKISKSLLVTSFAVDVVFILIIASERYYGIVHPYREKWSTSKSRVVKCSLVVACFVLPVPLLIVYDVDKDNDCLPDWSRMSPPVYSSTTYYWSLFILFFMLPLSLIHI